MSKSLKEKLDEYDTRIVKWCLASGAITQFTQPGVVYPAAQNHWKNRKPHPLTSEEYTHRHALGVVLAEEAKEVSKDDPQHLLFYTQDEDHKIKFVK